MVTLTAAVARCRVQSPRGLAVATKTSLTRRLRGCPKRIDCRFALCGERREVAAFEAAKAERYVLQREAVLLAESPGEFADVGGFR